MNQTKSNIAAGVDDRVLVQIPSTVAPEVADYLARKVGGLVLTDRPGIRRAWEFMRGGFDQPMVLDLLDVAGEQGHEAWVRRRRVFEEAAVLGGGNHLVTPSRRVAAGDLRALDAQLDEAMTLVSSVRDTTDDAFIGLALDAGWFKHSANVDELHSRLQAIGDPTAIALAAPYDPLGAEQSVHNLRRLVQSAELALLRSDLAAVGAWAWGARFSSVGLTSTVRHLPVPMRLSNPGHRTPHVLMPGVLAWIKASRLHFADGHPLLRCWCAVCDGRSLGRLGDETSARHDEARMHSFYVWQQLVEDLSGASASDRPVGWQVECQKATEKLEELEAELGVEFSRSPLRWWVSR